MHPSHRWNRPGSVLRALVPTLVLVLGMLAAPSASAAVVCSFDAGTGIATITFADGNAITIERSGDDIAVNGLACTGATVTTTDTIWILESGPGAEDLASLTIDMSGGPFAPGKTDEGDGSSEIEFLTGDQDLDADRMTLGAVTIVGTLGNDTILIGNLGDGGYSPIDLNGDEETLDWDIPGFGVDGADLDTPPAVDGGAGDDDLRAGGQVAGAAGSSLVLRGGDGDDTLVGGADFDDQIDGGEGTDTIVAAYESSIDLATGVAASIMGDTDTLSDLENIVGSGNGSDILTGDEGPNRIEGGSVESCPDCNILGDVISGGGGDDELIGSEWLDTVDFSGATSGVVVDVPAGTATGEGNDTIAAFERIDGSAHDDRVVIGPDLWWIYAGDGTDTLDLSTATAPVHYLMASGLTIDGQHTLAEGFENVIGSPFADVITGTLGRNRMVGGRGADELGGWEGPDILLGRHGADVLHGAEGRDELYGGRGNDLLSGDAQVDTCLGGPGHDVLRSCEILKPPAE